MGQPPIITSLASQLGPLHKRHRAASQFPLRESVHLPLAQALELLEKQASFVLEGQLRSMETTALAGSSWLRGRYMPYRNQKPGFQKVPHDLGSTQNPRCRLCPSNDPLMEIHRGPFRIASNLFRYGESSLLLLPEPHLQQQGFANQAAVAIELMSSMGSAYTFFYNGLKGNSQEHLHIQALKETLPIRAALQQKALACSPLGEGTGTSWHLINPQGSLGESNPFYGIHLVSQKASELPDEVIWLMQQQDAWSGSLACYHLVFWFETTGTAHAVLMPRSQRSPCLGGSQLSSLAYAGMPMFVYPGDHPQHYSGEQVLGTLQAGLRIWSKAELMQVQQRML